MHAIECIKVKKIYRKGFRGIKVRAVTDLTFSVSKERITGFVGPNGAGKTTTIKMIIGLVRQTSGSIILNGTPSVYPAARNGVAYLSEQPYFYTHLTVREMLLFASKLIGLSASTAATETKRVLGIVELTHKARSKVKELSKGMQQRLNMAQALLGNPQTLILDEPMSGMDPPGRRLFREILQQLKAEKRTIFFSTHILDDIETICDDVVVLHQGNLTYDGNVRKLLRKGQSGTEINTGTLPEILCAAITKNGCSINFGSGDSCSIVVPAASDPAEILKLLAEHEYYPLSVVPRTMRLEELLYRKKKGVPS